MDEIKIKESGKKIEGKNLIRKLDKKDFLDLIWFDLIWFDLIWFDLIIW